MTSPVSPVVSSLPGRLRLRHASLRQPARLEQLRQTLAAWPESRAIQANPATGSLLLSYDVAALPQSECEKRCEAALAALLPPPATPATPAVVQTPRASLTRTQTLRANRLAKRGMLASLAASMALAAVGAKRAHIWTGVAFLHALGVHLWVYRRSLLR